MGAVEKSSFLGGPSLLQLLPAIVVLGLIAGAVYRLYLSPLSRFPGPKIAALTRLYEFYYDCVKAGKYYEQIERMHKQYGPIVRISPNEIHVDDPDWNEPYKMSARVNKDHWYYTFVGSSDAGFGTADHELHRIRRAAQAPYFTQAAVNRSEPQVHAAVKKLCDRIAGVKKMGEIINLADAFRSLATDVVTEFAFHKSYNLLDTPDFAAGFHRTLRDFSEIGLWHRHIGFILELFQALPRSVVALINPSGVAVIDFFNDMETQTNNILATIKTKSATKSKDDAEEEALPDVVQQLSNSHLPESQKTPYRLTLEVRTIVAAGTETTGNTLTSTTYHLLDNPSCAQKLREELLTARKNSETPLKNGEFLPYATLQHLPYLSAVIQEGLRISSSVTGRLPRVNPRSAMPYKNYSIPPGTVVSTTQKLTHDNPSLFPEPRQFKPERWLGPEEERKRLEKYVIPFGRGSRSCLGVNLATMELYLAIAGIFEQDPEQGGWRLQLYETSRVDIEQEHDFFSPFPKADAHGLRAKVV